RPGGGLRLLSLDGADPSPRRTGRTTARRRARAVPERTGPSCLRGGRGGQRRIDLAVPLSRVPARGTEGARIQGRRSGSVGAPKPDDARGRGGPHGASPLSNPRRRRDPPLRRRTPTVGYEPMGLTRSEVTFCHLSRSTRRANWLFRRGQG